jgi:CheY-like chemotaxis protein
VEPRVLVVRGTRDVVERPEPAATATAVVPDGEAALALLRREHVDVLVVDLALAPLDGWCVLAAVGGRPVRPWIVALTRGPHEVARARLLGADLCVAAGTLPDARALVRSTKEAPCHAPRPTDSRRPMTAGARG